VAESELALRCALDGHGNEHLVRLGQLHHVP
jgi:hypothetical protein